MSSFLKLFQKGKKKEPDLEEKCTCKHYFNIENQIAIFCIACEKEKERKNKKYAKSKEYLCLACMQYGHESRFCPTRVVK